MNVLWRLDLNPGTGLAFECPGCGCCHYFEIPRWAWNGSMEKPTFTPSLWVCRGEPKHECHLVVTNGVIQFVNGCWHHLSNQAVPMLPVES